MIANTGRNEDFTTGLDFTSASKQEEHQETKAPFSLDTTARVYGERWLMRRGRSQSPTFHEN